MADLAYSDLVGAYPEFTTVDSGELARIGTCIDLAESMVATGVLATSDKTTQMRLALTAHLYALMTRTTKHGGGGTGAVSARTFSGGSTVAFAGVGAWPAELVLTSTPYGLQVLLMARGCRWRQGVVS
tara:strand:+ start:2831 stop:3214 length:384 start_codon:yes stop_codon:yes gene_type:complete